MVIAVAWSHGNKQQQKRETLMIGNGQGEKDCLYCIIAISLLQGNISAPFVQARFLEYISKKVSKFSFHLNNVTEKIVSSNACEQIPIEGN